MTAWQSISNSHQEYLIRFSPRRSVKSVTLFRDSRYIRLLNAVLSLELGAIELYSRCQNLPTSEVFLRSHENHRDNAQQLRSLIISNRGIPDFESTAISTELCILATRVGAQFGKTISHVTAIKLCVNREKMLRRKYLEVLSEAPFRDKDQLNSLLLAIKSNIICLKHLG